MTPVDEQIHDHQWRRVWRPISLGVLYVGLFFPQLVYLVSVAWEEEKYSHGYLISFVSLWYLWVNWDRIARVRRDPANAGMALVTLGIIFWMYSQINTFNALAHLSMILVIVGMITFAAGWRFLRVVAFPVFYLMFAFPVPRRLDDLYVVLPLQRFASVISEHIIDFLGIPVYRAGNVIEVPGIRLLVEEACSGIHSLYSLLALGTAFVYLTRWRPWERAMLIASTVPIAIFANVFRVTLTGVLATWASPEFAKGFFHEFSGLMVFLLGLVTFLVFSALMRAWFFRPLPPEEEMRPAPPPEKERSPVPPAEEE